MTASENNNELNPLEILQKLVEAIAAVIYQIFTKGVLIFGVGSLIIILILYVFFKLIGF